MTHGFARTVADYSQLRTIPAILGVVFTVCSIFQFGGMAAPELLWVDYTLSQLHAAALSMVVMLVAFMSSKTKEFAHYNWWEQVLIPIAPVLILGHQFVDPVGAAIDAEQSRQIVATLASLLSWGAAVR